MLLCHRVGDGDKMLVLHILYGDGVINVSIFCLQRWQRNTAATDYCVSGAVDRISADRADIEFAPQHIGGDVSIGNMLAVHQLDHGNAQHMSQRLQQSDIRQTFGGLPFGYGLTADADLLRQFRLGQIFTFPQLLDGCSGHIGVHKYHALS